MVEACEACQMKTRRGANDQRHTYATMSHEGYPFQRLSIDLVGPFPMSPEGYTHQRAASVQVITQDMQDFMDRPDTDWDAIHKLAAEQKMTPKDAPPCRGKRHGKRPSRRGDRHRGERQVQAGQAGQAGEVHGPVVPVAIHPGDA
jgi:hypothetical protein